MTKNIEEQIAQIHREFRSMMNGPISQSVREKGGEIYERIRLCCVFPVALFAHVGHERCAPPRNQLDTPLRPTDRCKSNTISLPDWNYNGIQPADANAHDSKNATRITSLPQVLHDNGYYTIHCGTHFAAEGTAGEDPLNMGFDVNIAGAANYLGILASTPRRFMPTW